MAGRYVHRCPECRTRRVSFKLLQQHMRDTGHKVCDCGGEFVQVNARDLAALVMVWDQTQEARKERHEQALSKARQEAQADLEDAA